MKFTLNQAIQTNQTKNRALPKGRLLLPLCLAISLTAGLYLPLQQTATPLLAAPVQQAEQSLLAVVDTAGGNLYQAISGPLLHALPPGTILAVVGRTADAQWLAVRTADNIQGWVSSHTVVFYGVNQLPIIPTLRTTMTTTTTISATTAPAVPLTSSITGAVTVTLPLSLAVTASGSAPTATLAVPLVTTSSTATLTSGDLERPTVRILSKGLNIRSGPGMNFAVVGESRFGQHFVELGRAARGAWVQIEVDPASGKTGWVAAGYVRSSALPEPGESAAVTKEPSADASGSERVATARPAGLSGQLVIQSMWGGIFHLYDLTTGELRALTSGIDPAISPDGGQIAFTRIGGNDNGIYLIDRDGRNERKIFGERDGLMSPKWSPDGAALVFSYNSGFYKCRLVGFSSCLSDKQIIAQFDLPPNPKIQSKIINEFERVSRLNWMVARIATSGADYRDLMALDSARAPDWTEAGIVYQSAGGLQVTQDTPDAETALIFADGYGYDWDPDWQPGPAGAAGRIVFQSREGSHWEIFAVNPDGSGHTALTRPATALVPQLPSNVAPVWSPDGQHIAFLSNRGPDHRAGPWRVWVMDADGGNQRPLPVDLEIHYGFSGEQMISWGP